MDEKFTSWQEERLYVLRTIEDLKAQSLRQAEAAAVSRENVEKKAERDIKAAHDKIRAQQDEIHALQSEGIGMTLKNWILTLIVGAGGAVALELFRWWIAK